MPVPPDALALYAAVILILPMAAFLLSSPTFLLVGLEVPEVAQLLRGLFNGYFLVMGIAGTISAAGLLVAGRPVFALGGVTVTILAVLERRWFLEQIDAALDARAAGSCAAVPQLRALHVKGMLLNALQLAIVVASVPLIV